MSLISLMLAALNSRLYGGEASVGCPPLGENLDPAIRRALSDEVAGAAPRADDWPRLQRRIAENEARPIYSLQPMTLAALPFSVRVLSRFSQMGVAMLVLLMICGGVTGITSVGDMLNTHSGDGAQVTDAAVSSASARVNRGQFEELYGPQPAASADAAAQTGSLAPIAVAYAEAPDPIPRPSSSVSAPADNTGGKTVPPHTDTPQ